MALYKVYNAKNNKSIEVVDANTQKDAFGYILDKYNIETVKKVDTNVYECKSKTGDTFFVYYKPDIITLDDLIKELNKVKEMYGGDKRVTVFGNYGVESKIEEIDYFGNGDVIYLFVDIG